MKTINVNISSIGAVKDFVNIVNKYNFDMDLISSRYVVDAKSIMGIFSLDLTKPITMNVHCDDCDSLLNELKEFVC